jgi:hypothetical protein
MLSSQNCPRSLDGSMDRWIDGSQICAIRSGSQHVQCCIKLTSWTASSGAVGLHSIIVHVFVYVYACAQGYTTSYICPTYDMTRCTLPYLMPYILPYSTYIPNHTVPYIHQNMLLSPQPHSHTDTRIYVLLSCCDTVTDPPSLLVPPCPRPPVPVCNCFAVRAVWLYITCP